MPDMDRPSARLALPARLRRAGAALALALLGACGPGADELTVVLISLDTTRLDHLSAYGYGRPTTPNLERLAREGVRFDQARAPTSWTLPSHMSLFTGLPPGVHDVNIDFQALDASRRTLGEIFRDGGFRTMGVFSGPYVHAQYGFGRGFDYYERGTQDPMLFDLTAEEKRTQAALREHRSHTEVTSALVVDRAIALLRNSGSPRNLLFLHFFDPHYDYRAPRRIARAFTDPAYKGPITGDGIVSRPDLVHAGMPAADLRQLTDLYDAELAWVDENIGRLLDALREQGRLERTLIVVTADHGEEFFERGRFGHRNGLSEQTLRVPLIVWGGAGLGLPAGRTVDDEVATYDILPTLVDYAGLPPEPTLYGRSLRPAIEGRPLRPAPVAGALTFIPREPQGWYVLHRSAVFGGFKVVSQVRVAWTPERERDLAGPVLPGSETVAVHDLATDPLESRDLTASEDPAVLERVRAALRAYEEEQQRQRQALQQFVPQGVPDGPGLDLTLMETLEQLGYLGLPEAPAAGAPAGSR